MYAPLIPSIKHIRRVFVLTVPVAGVGNEGRIILGPSSYLNTNLPFVELPEQLMALCRHIPGSERHR